MADIEAMKKQVSASLEANSSGDGMGSVDVGDLMDAMAHPKAAEVVQELMALEPNTVQQGEAAPEFSLPRLSNREEVVSLSSHFGKRPVGLIFGSYT